MKATKWIMGKAIRFCFPYIAVNIIVMILTTVISFAVTVINRKIINELVKNVGEGHISILFIMLLLFYMIFYFIQNASGFMIAFGSNFYRLNVDAFFHSIFMWKSSQTSQEFFYDSKFMEKYTFVSRHTNKISSYIGNLSELLVTRIGSLIGTMVLFMIYEPFLILYAAVIGVLTFCMNYSFSQKEYKLDKSQIHQQRYCDYYKEILTSKKSAKELRIYNTQNFFYCKWKSIYEKLKLEQNELRLRKVEINNIHRLIKFGFRVVAIGLILIGVFLNRYDLGTFVMLFELLRTCVSQMDGLAQNIIQGSYKDIKYLNDYYDFVTPISNEEIKNIFKSDDALNIKPYGNFCELRVEKLTFRYPYGEKNAVEDLSFVIRKGEVVSVLGYNGSGKTTLSKLLSGSLEAKSGFVTINGNKITKETRQNAFVYFGIAPQEFPRFTLPLCDVVGLGQIDKYNDRNELDIAYKKVGLNEFINNYPKGERTILGKEYDDEGIELSGGEWQRLTIASAYMGQPEILILDEPTASTDPFKEMEMLKKFRENLEGRTAILISHRIGFARLADRIIMMENGKITEQGSHDELIERNGNYAKLFRMQRELYEEA